MNKIVEKNSIREMDLICKPLDSYNDIINFLQKPPTWRSLCKELKPHSELAIRNMEVNEGDSQSKIPSPQTFCHFDPEKGNVSRCERNKLPKTLVCHDMANGYHDDSMIDGTGNYEAYTFYNWGAIDIFCYFSHHLITIPPLGWINVGHAHGVKVIGTIITEWTEGAAFWDNMFQTENMLEDFASALVAIAKTLKFDGWLLNIENKISQPQKLLEFVQNFHRMLHEELNDPVLIWYDSVTVEGHLTWQNSLNEKNKYFFDSCDGIFTNYSWSPKDVLSSASLAGDRVTDVYIGIDVWGRNFLGGGQFNTQEAVEIAYASGCSLAIFAPAWTHEAICEDGNESNVIEGLSRYEQFLLRDRALWGSLWPYLNTKLPSILPFQTSFCRGQGIKRTLYGEVLCPVSWYNLRHMQYQPNSSQGPHGYVLSAVNQTVTTASEVKRKKKGILRRTRSSPMESKVIISDDKSTSDIRVNALHLDSLTVLEGESSAENQNNDEKSVKIRVKNVFKRLFNLRDRKVARAESNTESLCGKSMTYNNMSVHINLASATPKTRYTLTYVPKDLECLEPYFADSFIGGSCLKVNPSDDEIVQEQRIIRIFHCDFYCEDSLIACVVTKPFQGYDKQFLNIKLSVKDNKDNDITVVLIGRNIPRTILPAQTGSEVINLYPVNANSPDVFTKLQKYMLLNHPGVYMPLENSYGWNVWYYEICLPKSRITSVNCRTRLPHFPILLGYFGLCPRVSTDNTT